MEPKYKLRITKQVPLSARRVVNVTSEFVWVSKDDALACKALLEKAERNTRCTTVKFVEFTEEKPLE